MVPSSLLLRTSVRLFTGTARASHHPWRQPQQETAEPFWRLGWVRSAPLSSNHCGAEVHKPLEDTVSAVKPGRNAHYKRPRVVSKLS